jgi:hypothetical protein
MASGDIARSLDAPAPPGRFAPKGPNEPALGEAKGTEPSSRNEPCKGGTRDGLPGRPRRSVSRGIPDLRLQSRMGDSRVLLIGHGGGSHLAGSGSTARADFRLVGEPVRGEPGWIIGS